MSDLTITIPGEPPLTISTVGVQGARGSDGTNGTDGTDGIDGTNGVDGDQGPPGPGTLLKDDKNALRAETGTGTAQLPDGSIWNVSTTSGHDPSDDDDATALLRPDGYLWLREVTDNIVQLDWWPLHYDLSGSVTAETSTTNARLMNGASEFATARFNAGNGWQALKLPQKDVTYSETLYIRAGVHPDFGADNTQSLTFNGELPFEHYDGLSAATDFTFPYGSDHIDENHLRVGVMKINADGTKYLECVAFTATVGATSSAIVLTSALTADSRVYIWGGKEAGAIAIEGQPNGIRDAKSSFGQIFQCSEAAFVLLGCGSVTIERENHQTTDTMREGILVGGTASNQSTNIQVSGKTLKSVRAAHTITLEVSATDIKSGFHASSDSFNCSGHVANDGNSDVIIKSAGDSVFTTPVTRYVSSSFSQSAPADALNLFNFTRSGSVEAAIGLGATVNDEFYIDTKGNKAQMITGGLVVYGATHGMIMDVNALFPFTNGALDLGYLAIGWDNIYTVSGVTTTSDEKTKDNIEPLISGHRFFDKFIEMAPKIQWIRYKVKDRGDGTKGKRWHYGVGARALWALCISHGIDPLKHGFLVRNDWIARIQDGVEVIETPVLGEDGQTTMQVIERPRYIEVPKIDPDTNEVMQKYSVRYQELHSALQAVASVRAVETQLMADRLDALEAAQVGAG